MFRLFRKQVKTAADQSSFKSTMAATLLKPIRHAQIRFVTVLSKQESRLSVRQKKGALLIFLISMGSLSSYWVYEGIFLTSQDKPGYLKRDVISQPKNTALPDTLDIKWLQEYKRWKARKDSLTDSLKR